MAIIEILSGGTLMDLSVLAHREDFDVISSSIPEDIFGGEGCPDVIKVFADDTDNYLHNDFSTFMLDAGIFDVSFNLLKDCRKIEDLNDDSFGEYYPKGFWDVASGFTTQQSLYTGYKLDWQSVWNAHGVGNYSVEYNVSLGGSAFITLCSCSYLLLTYSDSLADKTIRIRTIQNGHILDSFDYTGMNLEQCWRMDGFFGYPQDKLESDSYLDSNRDVTQIQDKLWKEYTLQTDFIAECQKTIFNDILLSNEIFIDDYNLKNAYNLWNIDVIPTQSDSNYFVESTETFKEITFESRTRKKVKRNVK
jgi:hypothetical protein